MKAADAHSAQVKPITGRSTPAVSTARRATMVASSSECWMASSGQLAAQMPQPRQASASTTATGASGRTLPGQAAAATRSASLRAPNGQAGRQAPQPTQRAGVDGRRRDVLAPARGEELVDPGSGGGGIGHALRDGLGTGGGAADEHPLRPRLGGPVLGVELGDEPGIVEGRAEQVSERGRLGGGDQAGGEHHQVRPQPAQLRGGEVLDVDHRAAVAVELDHRR